MFYVLQQGVVVRVFHRFSDAWLFITLECQCYARILEPDGDIIHTWTINPAYDPSRPPIN